VFGKILIANRGEIACRIIKTCRRLGIQTVAVYSQGDRRALHVEQADEAVFIGPSPAQQSYLNIQTLIKAAHDTGAEAIHPGYGFLSENADFAAAVEAAGLVFIGPKSEVIRIMGDKLQAKDRARQAGVSLVPGSTVANPEDVEALVNQIGYPVLLKATAGGGGKGMRVIERSEDIIDSYHQATHEALSSFGDGRLFIEKYIEKARHIEIQLLGDHHGNLVALGERDCSLQRRHQKVMEESPSPFMTLDLRQEMIRQALALAHHVGYTSAGTVEFLVTPGREFYFLEVNTRLQVEHPVTEWVTGLDLVEQMIRIAAGEPLSFSATSFSGHAVEVRLYAEDADQDFMPCSGRLTIFDPDPSSFDKVRLDSGVEAGGEVSLFYDPMIAKLSAWAPERLEAMECLQRALAHFRIEGPITNAGFLERLLRHPDVLDGNYHTHFIADEQGRKIPADQQQVIHALAALIYHRASYLSLESFFPKLKINPEIMPL
jgi:propionyl-CoA carboxylase alpha chain